MRPAPLHARLLLLLSLLAPAGLFGLLGLLGGCATGPRTSAADGEIADEIEAMNRLLEERFRARDLLGLANLYADDALVIRPDSRLEGREAIDAYLASLPEPVDLRLKIFEIGGSDPLAYQLGRSYRVSRKDAVEHTTVLDTLYLWAKDEKGAWKITVDAAW